MYRIKQRPEDFFVREISSVKAGEEGRYSYFLLKKRNYTTMRALQHIAKVLGIQLKSLGFAGTKDKNAVTEQAVSAKDVRKERLEALRLKDIEIKFIGRENKPISLGDLEGNYFKIVARDADKEPKKIMKFRNFFGEQRFSKNNAQVGKAIVKKDFKNAVSIIMGNDGDNEETLKEHINKNPNDFVGALRKIPLKMLKMYVHAYQSRLWNMLAEKSNEKELPIIGFGTEERGKVKEILEKEGIKTRDFIIRELPELSSEGGMRNVFAEAKDLKIRKKEENAIEMEFILPKGSYATEFIRQCFQ